MSHTQGNAGLLLGRVLGSPSESLPPKSESRSSDPPPDACPKCNPPYSHGVPFSFLKITPVLSIGCASGGKGKKNIPEARTAIATSCVHLKTQGQLDERSFHGMKGTHSQCGSPTQATCQQFLHLLPLETLSMEGEGSQTSLGKEY